MKPFTKREVAFAVIGLIIAILAIGYGINLQQAQSVRNESNNASLVVKDTQLNELTNYNSTICGEYRKLYSAYKELATQHPPANGMGYALPGSAKGKVDDCYKAE